MFFYTYIFDFVLHFSCLNGCVGWKLCSRMWAWNGLPLNTYISMYGRTNKCYNKRGSRTNYVRCSVPHCTCSIPIICSIYIIYYTYIWITLLARLGQLTTTIYHETKFGAWYSLQHTSKSATYSNWTSLTTDI